MGTGSFSYLIGEGVRNIFANKVISFAAIGVLMACLLLIGSSMLFVDNVNSMAGYFESQNEVVVFLEDDIDEERIGELTKELEQTENVGSVKFVSRDEGLAEWTQQMGDDGTLLEWLKQDNPLQHSFQIVIRDLANMGQTLDAIKLYDGVDSISASYEVAQAVTGLKRGVGAAGVAIIAILTVVSLMIVANTIRITVFARRKEISIMKFVGATDGFIRLPFLSEGVIIGLISAFFAFFLLWGGYSLMGVMLSRSDAQWALILQGQLVPFGAVAPKIAAAFAGGGASIGAVGSLAFLGKYLKV